MQKRLHRCTPGHIERSLPCLRMNKERARPASESSAGCTTWCRGAKSGAIDLLGATHRVFGPEGAAVQQQTGNPYMTLSRRQMQWHAPLLRELPVHGGHARHCSCRPQDDKSQSQPLAPIDAPHQAGVLTRAAHAGALATITHFGFGVQGGVIIKQHACYLNVTTVSSKMERSEAVLRASRYTS